MNVISQVRTIKQETCLAGCCRLQISPYVESTYNIRNKYGKYKAGVFFYDKENDRTLLVQSRGKKWGAPKGTIEDTDESLEMCALREVQEETGIKLHIGDLGRYYRIDRTTYYYVEYNSCENILPQILEGENNDANSISWIKPQCVVNMYKKGIMDLNSHCKKLFFRFLKIDMKE